MRWFERTYLVVFAALLGLPLSAQSTDDLPSAPSATVQQKAKPAPPKPAPVPDPPQSPAVQAQPADQSSSVPAEQASNTTSDNGSNDNSGGTFRTRVDEVPVVFTVTDKHNHYVRDLNKEDFKVVDDGRPVLEIRDFRRETDLPLRVGLLVDSSASIRGRFKFEQEAATEFMNQTIRPKYDRAFVLGFDASLEITQEFTDNTELLSKGIRSLRPGNSTRLYDALYYACRERLLDTNDTVSVRKAIVLITDGEDNASRTTREEAIDMALRANVIVYTISTNVPR